MIVRLEAMDAIDQHGLSEPQEVMLPAREFQHPVARELIEERQHLAVTPEEREQVARALDEIAGCHSGISSTMRFTSRSTRQWRGCATIRGCG